MTETNRAPRFLQPQLLLGGDNGHQERVFSHRQAVFFLGCAVLLVPWTVWLFLDLPTQEKAKHWNTAWSGFDLMLIVVFVGCAVRMMRLSPRTSVVAAAAGALLVTDAWFDVMLSNGRNQLLVALAMALLLELPMAALCFRTSYRVLSLLDQARPYLREAGFRVKNGRLVPPAEWGAMTAETTPPDPRDAPL